jgi:1-deoxy-D-xylulose-5-phosphate reductoisomerase
VNFVAPRETGAPDLAGLLTRRLTILGSTGSIGLSTLNIVSHLRAKHGPDAMPLEALTAQDKVKALAAQAREFRPRIAVIGNPGLLPELRQELAGTGIEVAAGAHAIAEAAARPSDLVMVGIIGAAALAPTLAAVRRGAIIALANKECIVAAGDIFREALARSRAVVIPVDSEHNAAFQVLDFAQSHAVDRVTLTASGGPFREWSRERMERATPEQAVAHPNWSMGAKISVDSATLMNKGLELIEAHFLFALPAERLGVIVHPQSIVHCLVYYSDGSTLAHLSAPDMRTPISYALSWPQRAASPAKRLDLAAIKQLSFEEPDIRRFPCLGVAQDCLRAGGHAPNIMNAANEVAVEAFLNRRIGFLDIANVIESTLANGGPGISNTGDIEGVLAVDRAARDIADEICGRMAA